MGLGNLPALSSHCCLYWIWYGIAHFRVFRINYGVKEKVEKEVLGYTYFSKWYQSEKPLLL